MSDTCTALPATWTRVRLGDLGVWRGGGTPSKAVPAYWFGGTVPWVSPKDMKTQWIVGALDRITDQALAESSAKLIPSGSVLVVTRSGILEHSLPVATTQVDAAINQDLKALTPEPFVLPDYLLYALQACEQDILSSCRKSGTTVASIEFLKLLDFEVPLPPLAEQHRIVAEIETQFTRLDAAEAALKRARAKLKRLRDSVLYQAFRGELTRGEADRLYAKMWETDVKEVAVERQAEQLPAGWKWRSIGEVCSVHVGATPSRNRSEYWGGGIPWVSSGEVAFREIKTTRETISAAGLRNTSTTLHPPGTILIGMIGEGKTRGQVALLGIEACNNQNSAAIRVPEAQLLSRFLYYYLVSQYERTRAVSSGNNQPALNKSRVQAMQIPIAPITEQTQLVQLLEEVMTTIDSLDQLLSRNFKRAAALRQSILQRAFSGQLVPQNPDDEPASVLLERIAAERASAAPPRRKAATRRTKATPAEVQRGLL